MAKQDLHRQCDSLLASFALPSTQRASEDVVPRWPFARMERLVTKIVFEFLSIGLR